ncbi:hypothetical protein ACFQ0B_54950 [Nonomuraea thailandensis]
MPSASVVISWKGLEVPSGSRLYSSSVCTPGSAPVLSVSCPLMVSCLSAVASEGAVMVREEAWYGECGNRQRCIRPVPGSFSTA